VTEPVRVGIVDSGCHPAIEPVAARAFLRRGDRVVSCAVQPDRLNHGSSVSSAILGLAPAVELYLAQVFTAQLTTSALQIAAALEWLCDQRVQLVNLSLGLRHDRDVLRTACARATAGEVLICASSPARGEPVFPAAYPGVLRITGDARCDVDQFSWLNSRFADYGACPSSRDGTAAGASMGCAHLSGHIARFLTLERGAAVREWLQANAAFIGPERRGS
jgi:subtilisin family serine protease